MLIVLISGAKRLGESIVLHLKNFLFSKVLQYFDCFFFFLSYNCSQVMFHSALEENISVVDKICDLSGFGSRFHVPLEDTANIC